MPSNRIATEYLRPSGMDAHARHSFALPHGCRLAAARPVVLRLRADAAAARARGSGLRNLPPVGPGRGRRDALLLRSAGQGRYADPPGADDEGPAHDRRRHAERGVGRRLGPLGLLVRLRAGRFPLHGAAADAGGGLRGLRQGTPLLRLHVPGLPGELLVQGPRPVPRRAQPSALWHPLGRQAGT